MCPDNDCERPELCGTCDECGYVLHFDNNELGTMVEKRTGSTVETLKLCTLCLELEDPSAEDLAYYWADLSRKAAYE